MLRCRRSGLTQHVLSEKIVLKAPLKLPEALLLWRKNLIFISPGIETIHQASREDLAMVLKRAIGRQLETSSLSPALCARTMLGVVPDAWRKTMSWTTLQMVVKIRAPVSFACRIE
ncbi:hypothetical protein JTE90_012397 [Oedothorax gibbosus]|uniref:Uncharacterized protein n=1 Tax=Oedothorax gibbosus TaxID=931172 RepID=A0AAV6TWM1_9ARAC|nr:hypothetical protein JTE90_012397 [Oedothorax gibbosus]